MSNTRRQGIFWILTIPASAWQPPQSLPDSVAWLRGQRESGVQSGYDHWQLFVAFKTKQSLGGLKRIFGDQCHGELSRSKHAITYCWKEATRVPDTQFELGAQPIERSSKTDWDFIWTSATTGNLLSIPAAIRVVSYRTIRAIAADHDRALPCVRDAIVYWGPTGSGKSRRAWEEAGMEAYCKCPRSKFWCGYQVTLNLSKPRMNQMLCSMNFEVVSTSPTCSDGRTVIQCELRLRDHQSPSSPSTSGSPPTSTPRTGTPMPTD